jgi:glucose-1-phosphate cytidylyltransferase
MKVVILAGGLGTRLSEETDVKPKPMIEKGYVIKEYFANLLIHLNDLRFDDMQSEPLLENQSQIDWKVKLIDTGQETMTGGRIKRIKKHTNDESFILTYGDGLADLDIDELVNFHKQSGSLATVTAVKPPARFGALEIEESGKVSSFSEKFDSNSNWINGGFFVLEQQIFQLLEGDLTIWEKEPLSKLALGNQLSAFKHTGFWKPCDTLREKRELQELWEKGAPWKNW